MSSRTWASELVSTSRWSLPLTARSTPKRKSVLADMIARCDLNVTASKRLRPGSHERGDRFARWHRVRSSCRRSKCHSGSVHVLNGHDFGGLSEHALQFSYGAIRGHEQKLAGLDLNELNPIPCINSECLAHPRRDGDSALRSDGRSSHQRYSLLASHFLQREFMVLTFEIDKIDSSLYRVATAVGGGAPSSSSRSLPSAPNSSHQWRASHCPTATLPTLYTSGATRPVACHCCAVGRLD